MTEGRSEKYLKYIEKSPSHLRAFQRSRDELEGSLDAEGEIFLVTFAPVITAYTGWVLSEAKKAGAKRLYFMSRDGYLPLAAAGHLKSFLYPDAELRYLNVSRFSLRSAQYYFAGKKCLDTICTGSMDITFRKLMKRASLSDDECQKVAASAGMSGRLDERLDHRKIREIKEKLRDVPEFFEMVKEHAKMPYENTCGYLEQEGLADSTPKAIVDIGWIGTVQQSLLDILNEMHVQSGPAAEPSLRIPGYYFGLYEIPKTAKRSEDYHSFYIDPRKASGCIEDIRRKKDFSICLFESVCSSPEGMTVGYKKDAGGRYLPVPDADVNPNSKRIDKYSEILSVYAGEYAKSQEESSTAETHDADAEIEMIRGILQNLMGDPSKEEAEIFGSLLFCDDVLENDLQKVAADISADDLKGNGLVKRLMTKAGLAKDSSYVSGWPEGSIAKLPCDDIKNRKIKSKAVKTEHALRVLTELRKTL